MTDIQSVLQWRGHRMVDSSGTKIGKIEEIYLDNDTGEPEWALVHTGMFGSKSSFVPLAQASMSGGDVVVPYGKAQVKDAPQLDAGQELSQEDESSLYRHYGLAYGEHRSDSGLPEGGTAGHDVQGPGTDEAMTRSEEELRISTETRVRGRARLRKYVVTQQVEQTAPVRREEVRVIREPITEADVDVANAGSGLSEEEHEVVLHEEVLTVDKQVVPRERVRLDTETVVDEQKVSGEVRKEQIEVDEPDTPPRH